MRFASFYLAAASLAFAPTLRAEPQQPTPAPQQQSNRLESGRTIERAITSHQVDTFRIALDSGAMVRVAMTPRGIDLDVDLYWPRRKVPWVGGSHAGRSGNGGQGRRAARRRPSHRNQRG